MSRRFLYFLKDTNRYKNRSKDIDPDEIFLDSQNLPNFDVNQFEGRMEKSIPKKTFIVFGLVCCLIFVLFFFKSFAMQVLDGSMYLEKSQNNALKDTLLFAERGIIYDRNNVALAWNVAASSSSEFSLRKYLDLPGLSQVVGYVKYPQKDSSGFYYSDTLSGKDGVEQFYDNTLSGQNGLRIVEVDAKGAIQSQSVVQPPVNGKNITLSIDSTLNNFMYTTIKDLANRVGFTGGAGVIMNIHTGEIVAMVSYPEYDSQILTDGTNTKAIQNFLTDQSNPFLNRAIDGLYTPGSIIKPFEAVAALTEKVIDPNTKILSTGSISIPNPYDPSHPSIFHDWKPQGWVDMRHAIAVSSDVYFYEVGGGYQNQPGLGIANIDKYMNLFGFGENLPNGFFKGNAGTIPSPAWKAENFNGEAWNIGDTYHTAIGQYGFQVSPIQEVRAVASLANGGKLMDPSILLGGNPDDFISLNLDPSYLQIAREGMRLSVQEGVSIGLKNDYLDLGSKTGTAQLGTHNQFLNSWVSGFFPYDNPNYAFAVVMEQGPATNDIGGLYVMRQVFDWMHANNSSYIK
jgi:penicillin-binding protein 2